MVTVASPEEERVRILCVYLPVDKFRRKNWLQELPALEGYARFRGLLALAGDLNDCIDPSKDRQ